MKINIRSVLFNISNLVPSTDYNEDIFLEWAFQALRLINSKNTLEQLTVELDITDHIVILPSFKVINQVRIKELANVVVLDANGNTQVVPTYSNYRGALETNETFFTPTPCVSQVTCIYKYKVRNNSIVTNVKTGTMQIDYSAYAEEIEDNESIKMAIEDYIFYKLTQKKSLANDKYIQVAQSYYQKFLMSAAVARGQDNKPTLTELENIRLNYTNLLPRDRAAEFFTTNTTRLKHL